jgi:hypothetical protein
MEKGRKLEQITKQFMEDMKKRQNITPTEPLKKLSF